MNTRQNTTILYLVIALTIAFSVSTVLNVAIIPSILPPVLFAGALVFSNEKYLRYKKSLTIWITLAGLATIAIIEGIQMWFLDYLTNTPLLLILNYGILSVILLKTQSGVKIGLLQIALGIFLISVQYLFFTPKLGDIQAYSVYKPEILHFIFMSLYGISLLKVQGVKAHAPFAKTIEEHNTVVTKKGVSSFLKFIIIATLAVFILFIGFFLWVIVGLGALENLSESTNPMY